MPRPILWGPRMWAFNHAVAWWCDARYATGADETFRVGTLEYFIAYVYTMCAALPCRVCRDSFATILTQPTDDAWWIECFSAPFPCSAIMTCLHCMVTAKVKGVLAAVPPSDATSMSFDLAIPWISRHRQALASHLSPEVFRAIIAAATPCLPVDVLESWTTC